MGISVKVPVPKGRVHVFLLPFWQSYTEGRSLLCPLKCAFHAGASSFAGGTEGSFWFCNDHRQWITKLENTLDKMMRLFFLFLTCIKPSVIAVASKTNSSKMQVHRERVALSVAPESCHWAPLKKNTGFILLTAIL